MSFVDDSRVHGLQIGDVSTSSAVVWLRMPGHGELELSLHGEGTNAGTRQLITRAESDFTTRVCFAGLAPGTDYRIDWRWRSVEGTAVLNSDACFTTAADSARPVRFAWSADVCGQGWGIDPERGGLRIFEVLSTRQLDFFIHCGDSIYADHPLEMLRLDEEGSPWRNLVTRAKSEVARDLAGFRGNHRYAWLDPQFSDFAARVPQLAIWDDHEVVNNWSPGLDLAADARYAGVGLEELRLWARQAYWEYLPLPPELSDPQAPLYRQVSRGPLLDVFLLDLHSHRNANDSNLEEGQSEGILGAEQTRWLIDAMSLSTALWKVVAAGMPLGVNVPDGLDAAGRLRWQGVSNGDDGPPRGREREIAHLLAALQAREVRNWVWLCGDVHYAAAHRYDPSKAVFKHFDAFHEFVAGPLHAGSFGPLSLDGTFGPQALFARASPVRGAAPSAGYQSFGEVDISPSGLMTVSLRDGVGRLLHATQLEPVRQAVAT